MTSSRLVRAAAHAGAVSLLALALGACASRSDNASAGGASGDGGGGILPGALTSRWAPPPFATRPVDGERAAVLNACLAAANSLGYSVNRFDGASGRIATARRQTRNFDGARQDTLEITVSTLSPVSTEVAIVLREVIESGGGDERAGGFVTTTLVRDKAAYDRFFAQLQEALGAAPAAGSPPAVSANGR